MRTRTLVFAIALFATTTIAAIPQQINYQGYLTRTSGASLDTTVAMTFKLYTDSLAGSLLWTETRSSVTVVSGLFSARLGQLTTLPDSILNQPQVWLGIQVGADPEMTPRSRIVSVGYSYRVGTVDGASGGTITSDVIINNKINVGSGNSNAGNFANVLGQDNVASGLYSTVSGGDVNNATGDKSTVSGGQTNSATGLYSTVSGGFHNDATALVSTVSGGDNNRATGSYSTVSGGGFNKARGDYSCIGGGGGNIPADSNAAGGDRSTIAGGFRNTITALADTSTIGGGSRNLTTAVNTTVAGGFGNTAAAPGATVAGGVSNYATGFAGTVAGGQFDSTIANNAFVGGGHFNAGRGTYSTVAGGSNNKATVEGAFIGGGENNTASGIESSVTGGHKNQALASLSFVGGGDSCIARGTASTVSGGSFNKANGNYSAICGGGGSLQADSNTASGDFAFIGGGADNTASGDSSVVGGGSANLALAPSVTIGEGSGNTANAQYATVGGGNSNSATDLAVTIAGGDDNSASDPYASIGGGYSGNASGFAATIPGGYNNTASARYTFAAGRNALANDIGAFVWSDSTDATFSSPGINTFNVRSSGGVNIWTNSTANVGVTLTAGDNTWNSICDSTLKTRIARVNGKEMLDKIANLPVYRWLHKNGDPTLQHIGPMAQDFWNQFHVGGDSLKISAIDPSGIALAAIQELAKENDEVRTMNDELKREIAELHARMNGHDNDLAMLRSLVQTLATDKQQSANTLPTSAK